MRRYRTRLQRRRRRRIVIASVCALIVLPSVVMHMMNPLGRMEFGYSQILELNVCAALDATGLTGYETNDVHSVVSPGDVRVSAPLRDEDADKAREGITTALAAYPIATGATDVPTADDVIEALATSADKALLGTPTGGVPAFLFWCRQCPDLVYAEDDVESGHRAGDTYVSYDSNYTWATRTHGWSADEGLCYRREYELR